MAAARFYGIACDKNAYTEGADVGVVFALGLAAILRGRHWHLWRLRMRSLIRHRFEALEQVNARLEALFYVNTP